LYHCRMKMLTEKQPQSVCCRMFVDQIAEQVTKISAPKHFNSGRLSGVDFSGWITKHCGSTRMTDKLPALHFAGKSAVGSYLLGKALDSMGQKPMAPLGATKWNKSHDQQNAIKTYSACYSACLLHIWAITLKFQWLVYPYIEPFITGYSKPT